MGGVITCINIDRVERKEGKLIFLLFIEAVDCPLTQSRLGGGIERRRLAHFLSLMHHIQGSSLSFSLPANVWKPVMFWCIAVHNARQSEGKKKKKATLFKTNKQKNVDKQRTMMSETLHSASDLLLQGLCPVWAAHWTSLTV